MIKCLKNYSTLQIYNIMNYLDVYFMEELQKAIDSIVFELFNEDNERGYIKFRTSMMQDLTDFYISIIIGDKEYKEILDIGNIKGLKNIMINMYNKYK